MVTCNSKLRIFVGPTEISGLVDSLVYGLKEMGCDAESVLSTPHIFKYQSSSAYWVVRLWQAIGAKRVSTQKKNIFRKTAIVSLHYFWSWIIFFWALNKFNIFIFLYSQTITNTKFELWLLKKLRFKIIFLGVGSDTRPPYIDGALFSENTQDLLNLPHLLKITRNCKSRLKLLEFYADYWINAPASAHFHEKPFINWMAIGVPKRVFAEALPIKKKSSASVRILHSPSNSIAKGTDFIGDVIDRLVKKGYQIEFIKIKNMPNSRVMDELQHCDFVIDQVYSDAPMAAFAIEAALYGKPAIVGGYLSSWMSELVHKDQLMPTYFVLPKDLEMAIERLITDIDLRNELGSKAKDFVLKYSNPKMVAANLLRLIDNDFPEHWWSNPHSFCYVEGFGLPREKAKKLVESVIAEGGLSALQLSDKPDFERAFYNFKSFYKHG